MGLQEHAEAALGEYWAAARKGDGNGKSMPHYIVNHMRDAVAEATAEYADTIEKQARRIVELEALWPLIEEYVTASTDALDDVTGASERARELSKQIPAILKGDD